MNFNMVLFSMIGKNKYYVISNTYDFLILMETGVYGQWI